MAKCSWNVHKGYITELKKQKTCPSFLPCFGHSGSSCATGFYFILFNFVFLW